MKYKKITIEKIILQDATSNDRKIFQDDGYEYIDDNYFGEPIYEKVISRENIEINSYIGDK